MDEYIGLPFADLGRDREGLDCWGLVRLIYKEKLGLDLPSLVDRYDSTLEAARIGAIVEIEKTRWTEIPAGQEQPFDVIVMRCLGQPMHVGLVIKKGVMLHIEKGIESCSESYRLGRWKTRVTGFYRYA